MKSHPERAIFLLVDEAYIRDTGWAVLSEAGCKLQNESMQILACTYSFSSARYISLETALRMLDDSIDF